MPQSKLMRSEEAKVNVINAKVPPFDFPTISKRTGKNNAAWAIYKSNIMYAIEV